jgi:hypothetical protein
MHKLFISLGLTLTLLVGVGLYFIQGNSHGFNASLSNPQLRAEWEHMITQDPATGLVDVSRKEELTFASNLPSMRLGNGRGNDYEWEARGPFNFGGRTRGAAFDVRNEDIMIAGSVSGGIYKLSMAVKVGLESRIARNNGESPVWCKIKKLETRTFGMLDREKIITVLAMQADATLEMEF